MSEYGYLFVLRITPLTFMTGRDMITGDTGGCSCWGITTSMFSVRPDEKKPLAVMARGLRNISNTQDYFLNIIVVILSPPILWIVGICLTNNKKEGLKNE
jgi:hypothetical protein